MDLAADDLLVGGKVYGVVADLVADDLLIPDSRFPIPNSPFPTPHSPFPIPDY